MLYTNVKLKTESLWLWKKLLLCWQYEKWHGWLKIFLQFLCGLLKYFNFIISYKFFLFLSARFHFSNLTCHITFSDVFVFLASLFNPSNPVCWVIANKSSHKFRPHNNLTYFVIMQCSNAGVLLRSSFLARPVFGLGRPIRVSEKEGKYFIT